MYYKLNLKHYYYFHVCSNKYYYLLQKKKKKKGCLSHIGCVCLVSVVYNLSLQLQRLGHFVVVLWLCNVL